MKLIEGRPVYVEYDAGTGALGDQHVQYTAPEREAAARVNVNQFRAMALDLLVHLDKMDSVPPDSRENTFMIVKSLGVGEQHGPIQPLKTAGQRLSDHSRHAAHQIGGGAHHQHDVPIVEIRGMMGCVPAHTRKIGKSSRPPQPEREQNLDKVSSRSGGGRIDSTAASDVSVSSSAVDERDPCTACSY